MGTIFLVIYVPRPDQFNFLCHGTGGYKFLTNRNRKRKEAGLQSCRTFIVLAENTAECKFTWLSIIVKCGFTTILKGWETNFGELFEINFFITISYIIMLFCYILKITFGQ